jgi:hypothetical protein
MRHAYARIVSIAVAVLFALGSASTASAQLGIPVNIESVPPGATVYLDTPDGAPLGTTPITATRIRSGAHTLIFRMPNFEEARLSITVARRRETFRAVMRALGTIEVSAGNDGARGAAVAIDGQPVGTLGTMPVHVDSLPPGRHQIVATHDGYVQFEQWVDVQGGQTVRVTAMLDRAAPTTGSILVSADVQGAAIWMDGANTGQTTTTVLDGVPVGTHTVEIRGGDGTTPFSQTVLVQQGQRATVQATIRPVSTAPTTGSIAVITEATGAEVRINGTSLGAGVYSRDGLAPGSYVVQVIATGFTTFEQEVTVTAGQTTSVRAHMNAPPLPISITVTGASGASVIVDGGDPHPAPYIDQTAAAGAHAIIVRAAGYDDQSFTCNNTAGTDDASDCSRAIAMSAQAVPLHVTLTHPIDPGPATVVIDDHEVGQAPYEGRIAVGAHVIQVTAVGHQTYRRQLEVALGGGDITIDADLTDSSVAASAASTTHSALPTPVNHPWVDGSIGWPYLGEIRLGIGLHELFDAGFDVRSFGRVTEFGGRVRFGGRVIRQIALGAQARFGGGIGPSTSLSRPAIGMGSGSQSACVGGGMTFAAPDASGAGGSTPPLSSEQNTLPCAYTGQMQANGYPVNTAYFSIEGDISLLLEPVATVTLWTGLDITSDEYAGHPRNEHVYLETGGGGDGGCMPVAGGAAGAAPTLTCNGQRQTMARWRFGGAVEFNLDQNWGIWAIFEGIVAQTGSTRRLFGGFISDTQDILIYPRLGFTYKF